MRILLFGLCAALLAAQSRNQLTAREAAEGWVLLYDGEGIFGWTPEGGAEWNTDVDGNLRARSGDSGDMVLNTIFGDYQLYCEINAAGAKGSGLVLNGVTIPLPKQNDKFHPVSITVSGGKVVTSIDGKKASEQATAQPGTIVIHYRKGDSFSIRDLKLKPAGLEPLFNGRDLAGWKSVSAGGKPPVEWSVADGAIHVFNGEGQLESVRAFKDFVLQLEVRANSPNPRTHPSGSVLLRGISGTFRGGYRSQISNDYAEGDRAKPLDFGTGGIPPFQPARKVTGNDNEFVSKTIVVRGRHFSIWVNGVQVTDWDDPSPEGQSSAGPGIIGLQAPSPSANLDFRNLRIAELR